ncbi:MAG: histidine phosphatase family protein, partial [Actinobacteria bacterium]|nr:histidine phosphatase family protein [Actinomycetota bacterium]
MIASPLLRARETASYVTDKVDIDERFIELDYGAWDGLAMADVPQSEWVRWRDDPSFRPPGGESLIELDGRVRPALEDLIEEARRADVVVVSHVSPIKSAITWA